MMPKYKPARRPKPSPTATWELFEGNLVLVEVSDGRRIFLNLSDFERMRQADAH